MKAWVDRNYHLIMLAQMTIELLLLLIIAADVIRRW